MRNRRKALEIHKGRKKKKQKRARKKHTKPNTWHIWARWAQLQLRSSLWGPRSLGEVWWKPGFREHYLQWMVQMIQVALVERKLLFLSWCSTGELLSMVFHSLPMYLHVLNIHNGRLHYDTFMHIYKVHSYAHTCVYYMHTHIYEHIHTLNPFNPILFPNNSSLMHHCPALFLSYTLPPLSSLFLPLLLPTAPPFPFLPVSLPLLLSTALPLPFPLLLPSPPSLPFFFKWSIEFN